MPSSPIRTRLKRLAVIAFGGVILLALTLLALPTLLGTKWIYEPLVNRLEADDFKLSVDGVRLRWFAPLQFKRIEVKQTDGTSLVAIAEVRTDRGLFGYLAGYLTGGRKFGRVEIIDPVVDVKLLSDSTNLQRFAQAIEGKTQTVSDGKKREKPQLDLEVVVKGFSSSVMGADAAEPLVVIPKFDLNVQYLASDGPSRLKIGATEVLKEVELTPELVELGLGYAIPLLAESAWFDGKVSMSIDAIDIPLDDPIQSTGAALLTLHTVRSGPSEPAIVTLLDLIASIRGREPVHELVFVDGSQIAVSMHDTLVEHSGLQAGLPRVDPRLQLESSGTVGLVDRKLALILKAPVPIEQLARRDEVKSLGVPRVSIPIGGTLDDPVVEWNVLRGDSALLIGAIRSQLGDTAPGTAAALGALEGLASGQADETLSAAVDLIQQLRERRRAAKVAADEATQDKAADDATDNPDAATELTPSRRPLRDALRNLLRGDE